MTRRVLTSILSIAAVSVLLAGYADPASSEEYRIDPAHSFIQFRTKHLGFSWLVGRFNRFEGIMNYDPAAGPESQSIQVTIDATSLDTNHAERDRHLRGRDFFDVDQYPTVTFVSTGYQGDENGGALSGDLTLLGVTRSISFDVHKIGEGGDPWGGYRAGFEGRYVLKRRDFGMSFNLGPSAEEVEIELLIEAVRR